MSDKGNLVIVGAGLCGSLLAIRMAQRGHKVSVFEKRPDMRKKALDAGRSINLALSDRGWKALRTVGLEDKVREEVIPMHGRYIHPTSGDGWLSPYSGRPEEFINSVSRPGLNTILLNEAEKYPNVSLYFDHTCTRVDPESRSVEFRGPHDQEVFVHGDVIFGTDGAGSAVRNSLFRKGPILRFDYSQSWLKHGYKELTIPPAEGGGWRLEKNALHIWPRKDFMLIALPNLDGSFTVTLFLAYDGQPGFDQLNDNEAIESFFAEVFPTAKEHMPELVNDFHDNPTSALGTIRCYPWQTNGSVLLMGDAAHAIVPFYGQGMNSSLEDVVVLDKYVEQFPGDWPRILHAFQEERKPDADAIADLAIENYFEMRDHVDDDAFRKKRVLEMQLEKNFPGYSSKYNLVTFNEDTRYSIAKALGNKQDAYLLDLVRERKPEDIEIEELFGQVKRLREA